MRDETKIETGWGPKMKREAVKDDNAGREEAYEVSPHPATSDRNSMHIDKEVTSKARLLSSSNHSHCLAVASCYAAASLLQLRPFREPSMAALHHAR
jgi:hypothetical protein